MSHLLKCDISSELHS